MHIIHPFYLHHSHKEEGHFSIFKTNFYLSVRLLIKFLEMEVLANISLSLHAKCHENIFKLKKIHCLHQRDLFLVIRENST